MTNKKLELLKQIEKDIYVCSLESTFLEDAKSCAIHEAIEELEKQRWTPVSEELPKENEYIKDVCKYYLIQDEYGDMHVAHLSSVGWIPMDSLKAIGDEVIAWMPLPQPYKAESEDEE